MYHHPSGFSEASWSCLIGIVLSLPRTVSIVRMPHIAGARGMAGGHGRRPYGATRAVERRAPYCSPPMPVHRRDRFTAARVIADRFTADRSTARRFTTTNFTTRRFTAAHSNTVPALLSTPLPSALPRSRRHFAIPV